MREYLRTIGNPIITYIIIIVKVMGCVPTSDKGGKCPNPKPEEKKAVIPPLLNGPSGETKGEEEKKAGPVEGRSPTEKESKMNPPPVQRKLSVRFTGMPEYTAIRQRYKMLDVVGHGKYGVVYKAESKADPSLIYAIKVLKCGGYLDKKLVVDEIKILKSLDHPNIIKYYEEIEDGPYVFLVTEYCSGGELLDRISRKTEFNESEAAEITEKLLKALNHCHSKNIAHRDIKPENILYSSKDPHAEVKLIDFGLAKKSDRHFGTYQTMGGTPYYIAPEVIDGNYTFSCDIWSLGVVLHIMLSGYMPFSGRTDEEVFRNIKKGHISFENPVWEKVTPPGRDLVAQLLNPDENKRPTAAEALKHEWFRLVKTYPHDIDVLDPTIVDSIKRYQGATKFQKACMGILVKTLKDEQINKLVTAFNMLDKEKNGYILSDELLRVVHELHPEVNIKELSAKMHAEGNAPINYSQFIASALDAKQFLTTERLWALFNYLDADGTKYLTAENIQEMLNQSEDRNYTLEEVITMLKDHGIKETDRIDFKQFAQIMKKIDLAPGEDILQKVIK